MGEGPVHRTSHWLNEQLSEGEFRAAVLRITQHRAAQAASLWTVVGRGEPAARRLEALGLAPSPWDRTLVEYEGAVTPEVAEVLGLPPHEGVGWRNSPWYELMLLDGAGAILLHATEFGEALRVELSAEEMVRLAAELPPGALVLRR